MMLLLLGLLEGVLLLGWMWYVHRHPPAQFLYDRSSGTWFVYGKDGRLLVSGRHNAVTHTHTPDDHNPHGLRIVR